MSFNPNDNKPINISRTNYEEYFLLYVDDELNEDERLSVEKFLIAHPDLQAELDLLFNTRLSPETIHLEDKESLLSGNMKLQNVDEALLLYIDGELTGAEKKLVEEKLHTDSFYQLQYRSLLKTKLVFTEKIIYPYKKELYRHGKKRGLPVYWMRIAAAVIILLGMGVFIFTYQPKQDVVVADGTKKIVPVKKTDPVAKTQPGEKIEKQDAKPVNPTVIKTGETDDAPNVVRNLKKKAQPQKIPNQTITPGRESEQEIIVKHQEKEPDQSIVVKRNHEPAPQQTINNKNVTPSIVTSLKDETTLAVTAEQRDVVKTDNEKKSSLKGFLRKATRFIERRTNISTTNENNELVIGVVALKL
jgi:hypothetical protein